MKPLLTTAAAVSILALGGCATNPHTDYAVKSTAAGAALGIGTGAGAAIGFGVGSLVGSVIGTQTYHRDTRGYCYRVDDSGRVLYDYSVRC